MNLTFDGKYKSLGKFQWLDVPMFSVITGKNGSGKSQLLELIFNSIVKEDPGITQLPKPAIIDVGGEFYRRDEVIFSNGSDLTDLQPVGLSQLQAESEKLYSEYTSRIGFYHSGNLQEIITNARKNDIHYTSTHKLLDDLVLNNEHIPDIRNLDRPVFFKLLPQKYVVDTAHLASNRNIGNIFYKYRLDWFQSLSNGLNKEDFEQINGEKPWSVINKLFAEIDLPFRINDPEDTAINSFYTPQLTHTIQNCNIPYSTLSSGEKVLVTLVFWLFNSNEFNQFPRLLLLDEPDSYLHPSMTKQFIYVVNEVLSKKFNVRIIMTTHSPSTVALTPLENLFEMSPDKTIITKSQNKEKVISLLTDGLVIVTSTTKYVLVEGPDDKPFYETLFRIFHNENLISRDVSLAFIAGTNKVSVGHWSKGLRAAGLGNMVKGIIDKDYGNSESDGLFVLNRHSIENYLFDPILVFVTGKNIPLTLGYLNINPGEEHKIKSLLEKDLQKISNEILNIIQSKISDLLPEDLEMIEVEFINDKKISYPKWFLNRRGKDLRQLFQEVFGGPSVIHQKSLLLSLLRTGHIPIDLLKLFQNIQQTSF